MLKAAAQPKPPAWRCEVLGLRSWRRNFFRSLHDSARSASAVIEERILEKRSAMLIKRVPTNCVFCIAVMNLVGHSWHARTSAAVLMASRKGWSEKGKVKAGSMFWRLLRVRYIVLRQAQEGSKDADMM